MTSTTYISRDAPLPSHAPAIPDAGISKTSRRRGPIHTRASPCSIAAFSLIFQHRARRPGRVSIPRHIFIVPPIAPLPFVHIHSHVLTLRQLASKHSSTSPSAPHSFLLPPPQALAGIRFTFFLFGAHRQVLGIASGLSELPHLAFWAYQSRVPAAPLSLSTYLRTHPPPEQRPRSPGRKLLDGKPPPVPRSSEGPLAISVAKTLQLSWRTRRPGARRTVTLLGRHSPRGGTSSPARLVTQF